MWLERLRSKRAELDEAAFVLPVLLLVAIGLINLAILGFAAINANNAANYGARMGSVAQQNASGVAQSAAQEKLSAVRVGSYQVQVSGDSSPGGLLVVAVRYTVPNYIGGLAGWFGAASMPREFTGTAQAHFRKEGW